jgi:hypothetical protein
MTYTQLIIFTVLLNLGQAYIIYMLFMENTRLKGVLKGISKSAGEALSFGSKRKKLEPKKDTTPGKKKFGVKYYD